MKHILILLSLLILTSPLVAQETGVLYFKKVNGKFGWFENGNDKKDWKYIGEIKNGKPNGIGVLSSTFGKYSGELKNGMQHGQGTYTYKSGRKRVGEFRKGKPWNVKSYDKNGKIETEWVKGIKLKKVAQETGVLYFKKVNGKYGWFKNGDDKKDWIYVGEIKNGKPNGTGVLSSTSGKYSGELKNGMKHGQGTYTYKSGRKRVGEFRKGKPWNVNNYDKNGKIEAAWIKGIKLKWVKGIKLKKEEAPLEEKGHTENKSYKIEPVSAELLRKTDITFISATNQVSHEIGLLAQSCGSTVIDDSSVYRLETNVPLVVPEINVDDLYNHQGIISIPN
ncbi:MAG: hypothetical protein DSY96_07340, partial [SAR324 cluster bacterium]